MDEVRVIIDHGGVKREICGGFRVCLGAGTARRIIEALQSFTERAGFGWVEIPEPPPSSAPNTQPLAWLDPGLEMTPSRVIDSDNRKDSTEDLRRTESK